MNTQRHHRNRLGVLGLASSLVLVFSVTAHAQLPVYRIQDFAADGETGASLGYSGNRIIAGAPADDELGSFAGAARVYTKLANEERWFPSAVLRASDGENGDEFGNDVDISGDLAVVSAPFEDSQGLNAGAVYVFRFDGNQWNQEQKLVAADTVAGDLFGASIDIEGEQIFIGAPGKDLLGIDQGTAYIFRYDNGSMTWIEDGQLDPGVGNEGAQLGWSLDIHGDTILVGAPFSDLVADGAGAAFLFRWDTMQWVLEAQITAQDGQVDDAFGFSVAVHNDLAIVGAIGVTEAGPNDWVGAAYIFRQNSGTGVWEEEIKILENDGNPTDDYFGWSVDIKDQVATIGQHSNFLRDVTVYERRGGTNWVPYYWRNDFETNSIAILEDDLIILGGTLPGGVVINRSAEIGFFAENPRPGISEELGLVTGYGTPGGIVAFGVTGVDGIPFAWRPLFVTVFSDLSQTARLTSVVPPGLTGRIIDFQVITQSRRAGAPNLVLSNVVSVEFR